MSDYSSSSSDDDLSDVEVVGFDVQNKELKRLKEKNEKLNKEVNKLTLAKIRADYKKCDCESNTPEIAKVLIFALALISAAAYQGCYRRWEYGRTYEDDKQFFFSTDTDVKYFFVNSEHGAFMLNGTTNGVITTLFNNNIDLGNNLTRMEAEMEELNATIQKLTEELKLEKQKPKKEDILTDIVGSWRLEDGIGIGEFVRKVETKTDIIKSNPAWKEVFLGGVQNFEFDKESQKMTTYMTVLDRKTRKLVSVLGKSTAHPVQHSVTFNTFVERDGAQVTTVYANNDAEYLRRERFIQDGKLHVVDKRFGISCTRIYEKIDESEEHSV